MEHTVEVSKNTEVLDLIIGLISEGKQVVLAAPRHELRSELTKEIADYIRKDKEVTVIGFAEEHAGLRDINGVTYLEHWGTECADFLRGINHEDEPDMGKFLICDNYHSAGGLKRIVDYMAAGNPVLLTGMTVSMHSDDLQLEDLVYQYMISSGITGDEFRDRVVSRVISKAVDAFVVIGYNKEVKLFEIAEQGSEQGKMIPTDLGKIVRVGNNGGCKDEVGIKKKDVLNLLETELKNLDGRVIEEGDSHSAFIRDALESEYKRLIDVVNNKLPGEVKIN